MLAMSNISELTIDQLRQVLSIKEQIEELQNRLHSITGNGSLSDPFATPRKKRGMSAAGRARVAAAQRARWAKIKGNRPGGAKVSKKARWPEQSGCQSEARGGSPETLEKGQGGRKNFALKGKHSE
jgi:hypothetical protein